MLNEHYHCKSEEPDPVPASPVVTPESGSDVYPGEVVPEPSLVAATTTDTVEEDIDELLKDL